MTEISEATEADIQLQVLIKYVKFGFPEHKRDVCEEI